MVTLRWLIHSVWRQFKLKWLVFLPSSCRILVRTSELNYDSNVFLQFNWRRSINLCSDLTIEYRETSMNCRAIISGMRIRLTANLEPPINIVFHSPGCWLGTKTLFSKMKIIKNEIYSLIFKQIGFFLCFPSWISIKFC